MAQVLDELPADLTDPEDAIQTSLFLGRPTEALSESAKLDIWLAAHLADIVEAIELVDKEPREYVLVFPSFFSNIHSASTIARAYR